ncbi:uncharacterized protein LOC143688250 isoform X2 [Tamandua tetradactyla]|uniref:uncharacterized protein LOC143688250 isoform X2 n=1 Tax=Tamandua tetradactyla TaxID=48850 RepID=UPI004053876A
MLKCPSKQGPRQLQGSSYPREATVFLKLLAVGALGLILLTHMDLILSDLAEPVPGEQNSQGGSQLHIRHLANQSPGSQKETGKRRHQRL